MGVGHAAVAIGAAKVAPRVNVGWLIFAAFLADFLLGLFAWAGLEQAHVPPDFAARHYLTFTFPYSHGLVSLIVWGALFGLLVSRIQHDDRMRVFLLIAALVLSHYVLDGLVHVAGLPLAGENSPKFGLGLWKHLTLELTLESVMTVVAIVIFLRIPSVSASARSRWGIPIFLVLLAALTWAQLGTTQPPTPSQLIPDWIVAPILFSGIVYALDRKRAGQAQSAMRAGMS